MPHLAPPRPDTPLSTLTRALSGFSLQGEQQADRPHTPTHARPSAVKIQVVRKEREEAVDSALVWKEGAAEVQLLEEHWEELREAIGRYGAGMEEGVVRLQNLMTSHACDPASHSDDLADTRTRLLAVQQQLERTTEARTAAEKEVTSLKAERDALSTRQDEAVADLKRALQLVEEAQKREAVWRAKLEKVRDTNDALTADQQHWHKRESQLAKTFIKLEDEHVALLEKVKRSRGKVDEPFAVALIELSASLVDPKLIRQGQRGGKELARDITERCKRCADGTETIIIQIFLDVPKLTTALKDDGSIDKQAELHDFLDGFRALHALNTVIDCASPGEVLKEHLALYAKLGASAIVIATRNNGSLVNTVRRIDETHPRVLHFVQIRRQAADDQWAKIYAHRMVHIANITPGHLMETPVVRSSRVEDVELVTPAPRKLETPAPPKKPLRDRISSSITPSDSVSSIGDATPLYSYPNTEQRTAPWAVPPTGKKAAWRASLPSPPARAESPVPYWMKGGTLLEAHNAGVGSGVDTPRASRSPERYSPTPRKATRPGLSIPIGDFEGSIAGSPPDSDEDTPSVPLPHSAVKHVQRPTPVRRAPSEASSVSSKEVKRNAYDTKRLGQSRNPSATSTNATPLGMRNQDEKLHGFKVRTPWANRK